jgi:hypothetical protein
MIEHRPPLPLPEDIAGNKAAVEAVRAWMVNGESRVSLKDVFVSPADWGLLLFDIARIAADAAALHRGLDRSEVLASIREKLDAEFETSIREVSARPVYDSH